MRPERIQLRELPPEVQDVSMWPTIDLGTVAPKFKEQIERRCIAVRLSMQGVSRQKICEETGFTRQAISRLVRRCLARHPDNRIWGFRALLMNRHIGSEAPGSKRNRRKSRGFRGAMKEFFQRHPEIWRAIEEKYLHTNRRTAQLEERKIRIVALHQYFTRLCSKAGIGRDEYPRNVDHMGIRSLYRHIQLLRDANLEQAIRAQYGKEARTQLDAGRGGKNKPPVTRPYQLVACDGHRIDAAMVVEVEVGPGTTVPVPIHRLWLLVIRDTASRACLGYYISLHPEYTLEDVLACIKHSIQPHRKMTFSIPGLNYSAEGGFPSGKIPECAWACWDELAVDNARANLADLTRAAVIDQIGGAVNAGPVATPVRRAIVERYFGLLEEAGFHRLPSTTGSKAGDVRRDDADGKALKYRITLKELCELAEVLIADLNATPTEGIHFRSPLEYIEHYISKGGLIRQLPEHQRTGYGLGALRLSKTVRSTREKGVRPHINYSGARYTSDLLSGMYRMTGQKIVIAVNLSDLRFVQAYLESGEEFCVLKAQGGWAHSVHDLRTRKAIRALKRRRLIHYSEYDDPIEIYREYLASKAPGCKRSAAKHEKLRRTAETVESKALAFPVVSTPESKIRPTPTPLHSGMTRQLGLKSLIH